MRAFQTVDELIVQAVQAWRERNPDLQTAEQRRGAVARMQEFVEKNHTSLGEVSVKDLIHEGHRL